MLRQQQKNWGPILFPLGGLHKNLSNYCIVLYCTVLSSERINGQRAKTSRKTMRELPPLQNSKKGHQNLRKRGETRYCRWTDLMASVRKPRENLCASALHLSKTRRTRTQSGRRSRPLLVAFCRILERWNALAHSFSRGFRTLAINSFPRQ